MGGLKRYWSKIKNPTASATRPSNRKFSFCPWLPGLVFAEFKVCSPEDDLMPSGVNSKAQAIKSETGNPKSMTRVRV